MPTSAYLAQQVSELVRLGVEEARHGNRAAAAALLRRAVTLDPQHELAWLWLGGVAAAPEEAAFALRAALQLNPANDAARRGLSELEAAGRLEPRAAPPVAAAGGDTRWRRWRESRGAARSFGLLLWLLPVVLLVATAGLRLSLTLQAPVAQAPPAPRLAAKSAPTVVPSTPLQTPLPAPTATPPPAPTSVPPATPTQRGAVMAYLTTLDGIRHELRGATDAYLTTGDRRTTAERAAATRALRDAVQRAREQLASVVPPDEARDTHQLYLDGLAREAEALDDVLAFYGEYNLQRSNSATLRMQQARAAIDAAAKQWDTLARRYGIVLKPGGQN